MMTRLRIALEAMVVAIIIFAACSSTPRTAEYYIVGLPDEYGVVCYVVYQGISCVKVR